jgi:hypothetical protein
MEKPVHLQYSLTRWQRLFPLILMWHIMGPAAIVMGCGFFVAGLMDNMWNFLAFAMIMWFARGYMIGLANVILTDVAEMDIIVEPLGIGFLCGKERYYVSMDGVTSIRTLSKGMWTISHWNGTVFIIPKNLLPEECVNHIRHAIKGQDEYLNPFRRKARHRSPDPAKADN